MRKKQKLLHGCWKTAGYRYPEIATKKTLFCKYLRKNENIFENILGGYSRAYVQYYRFMKKTELENLMLVLKGQPCEI